MTPLHSSKKTDQLLLPSYPSRYPTRPTRPRVTQQPLTSLPHGSRVSVFSSSQSGSDGASVRGGLGGGRARRLPVLLLGVVRELRQRPVGAAGLAATAAWCRREAAAEAAPPGHRPVGAAAEPTCDSSGGAHHHQMSKSSRWGPRSRDAGTNASKRGRKLRWERRDRERPQLAQSREIDVAWVRVDEGRAHRAGGGIWRTGAAAPRIGD